MRSVEPPALELSVVMPCLNEAETVATCVAKAVCWLAAHRVHGEVVVADNGSTDGSPALAAAAGARVIAISEKGYGSALLGGILAARGRYVIMGDADDSYDFAELMPFMAKLREGYDLVMGNRFRGGIAARAMPPLHRYFGNPVLTAIGRWFFGSPCGDFHCGLRGFRRDAVLALDLRTTGMEFASEIVVKATLHRLRITEVPTTLTPAGRTRPPHLHSWRDGWRHLRFLLLYSPRWLFLAPGLALMAVGMLAGLWLLPGPRTLGSITLDVHTQLYAAASVIVGFQAVVFAVFTKVFAISSGLLPEDPRLTRWFRWITLEVGLAVGAALVLIGAVLSVVALGVWARRSFGPLDPVTMLRMVIPASTMFALGCQTILSSFFLSVLGLSRR